MNTATRTPATRMNITTATALNFSFCKSGTAEQRAELKRLAEAVNASPNPDAYAYATLTTSSREYRFRIGKLSVSNPEMIR